MNKQEMACREELMNTMSKLKNVVRISKKDRDDLLLLLHETADIFKMRAAKSLN